MGSTRRTVHRNLKRWPSWALLLFVVVGFVAVGSARDGGPQSPDDRVVSITQRLACAVCDGESVFESRHPSSENVAKVVEDHVLAGQLSDEEILAEIQRTQPEDVHLLLVPRTSGLEALAWAIPAAAVVCALAGLAVAFRRWRLDAARVPDPTDEDRELVAEALGADDGGE